MANAGFSDVYVRSLPRPEKGQRSYWDGKLRGFGVRVSQGGAKTFVLNKNNSLITIGRFPILSLADARTEARRILAERTLGKVRPQSISFQATLALFLDEKQKARRARTHHDLKARLNRHFPFKCQLAEITHDDIARRLSKIPTAREHNHALRVGKTFFNWAVNRRYLTESPMRGFSMRSAQSRARVLSDDELKRVWNAAEQCGTFGVIVKLLTLTGQRRGEIAALQPSWIARASDASAAGYLWTITLPASITKNGREHTFPIGELAASMLQPATHASSSPFLFPARGRAATPFNGWSKSKGALDQLSGVENWTLHDLRRTFASNLAALGVPLPVIEKLLNHVSGTFAGIVAVYQRHNFMPEMRDAALKWEARLSDIVR